MKFLIFALALFSCSSPACAQSPDELLQRGEQYYEKGEYNRAIQDFNEAIRLKPELADAFYDRGLAYGMKGDLERALQDFSESIRLKPSVEAFFNRGDTYVAKGESERAIGDFTRAIGIKGDYAEALYNRGLLYYCKNDREDAIDDFRRAVHADPEIVSKVQAIRKARREQLASSAAPIRPESLILRGRE